METMGLGTQIPLGYLHCALVQFSQTSILPVVGLIPLQMAEERAFFLGAKVWPIGKNLES